MARIYRRGRAYYADLTQNGRRYRKSLGENKKAAEIEFQKLKLKQLKEQSLDTKQTPVINAVAEYLEHVQVRKAYKTWLNSKMALSRFVIFCNENRVKFLQTMSLALIDGYVSSRSKEKKSIGPEKQIGRATVNLELKLIKRFFNWAVERDYIELSPARKAKLLSIPAKDPQFFKKNDIARILQASKDAWFREIMIVLFQTGMRIGELVNLEWSDIDIERAEIAIRTKQFWMPKSNRERTIPLADESFCLLQQKKRLSQWVFADSEGNQLKIHSLQTRFQRMMRKLGLPGTLHWWRHSFASYLCMNTGDIRGVQLLLGHSSIKTTEIYAHLDNHHLHELVNKASGMDFGTLLGTPLIQPQEKAPEVIENGETGKSGFEPVTPTV